MNKSVFKKFYCGIITLIAFVTLITSLDKWENGINLLITSTTTADILRLGVLLLMAILIVTRPPRSSIFRALIFSSAIGLLLIAPSLLFTYSLSVIDTLVFVMVGVVSLIDALEPGSEQRIILNSRVAA